MGKFLKYGRVVILLTGRFAGKKAVIIKCVEDSNKERKYGHALVAGIARYPRKVVKGMSKKRIQKRTNIKPFLKYVNLNHIMPTRYQVSGELDLKHIAEEKLGTDKKKDLLKALKTTLQDKYRNLPSVKGSGEKGSHLRFLFKKLRF